MRISQGVPRIGLAFPYVGHQHFWQRAMARRQLFQASLGITALAMGAGLGGAVPAFASPSRSVPPKPIPTGSQWGPLAGFPDDTTVYHAYYPAFGQEVATITDFDGYVAAAEVQGTGTATNTSSGATVTRYFDVDMRFMQGTYIGVDGNTHAGTFGFI